MYKEKQTMRQDTNVFSPVLHGFCGKLCGGLRVFLRFEFGTPRGTISDAFNTQYSIRWCIEKVPY